MSAQRRRQPKAEPILAELAYAPERAQHDKIAPIPNQITDSHGNIAAPHRVVDVVASMVRRRVITDDEAAAADQFRDTFRRACLDNLRASDPSRPIVSGKRYAEPGNDRAKAAVNRSMTILGGYDSLAASAIWHIIGLDMNVSAWSQMQRFNGRHISDHVASGVLITALQILARK